VWMREFGRRLTVLFRREPFDRVLEAEMQFHLMLRAEKNRETGGAHPFCGPGPCSQG